MRAFDHAVERRFEHDGEERALEHGRFDWCRTSRPRAWLWCFATVDDAKRLAVALWPDMRNPPSHGPPGRHAGGFPTSSSRGTTVVAPSLGWWSDGRQSGSSNRPARRHPSHWGAVLSRWAVAARCWWDE